MSRKFACAGLEWAIKLRGHPAHSEDMDGRNQDGNFVPSTYVSIFY